MTIQLRKSMLFAAALTGLLFGSQLSADAAEIHFRATATSARGIVRLGDVAEVVTSDADEARLLEGIALVPSPGNNEPRLLKRQEVQQLLQLSGISLREHRFTGAEVTQIQFGSNTAGPMNVQEVSAASPLPLTPAAITKTVVAKPTIAASLEAIVGQAIVAHLNAVSEIPAEWQAEVAFSPRVAQLIAGQPIIRVEGGVSPWLGRQQFMLLVGNAAAPTRLPIEAEVAGTTKAVTMSRMVERGSIIAADDVQLQTVSMKSGVRLTLDANQIIGREATRSLNAGQLVGTDMVRAVRLVKRGDDIQVFSIGAGVQVNEPGKALADGSQGDSIAVEFADRRKMTVRVTGPRRGEIYAMQTSRSQVQATSQQIRR